MHTALNGLYLITDSTLMSDEMFHPMCEAALSSGVAVIQYRDKSSNKKKRDYQARQLKALCEKHNTTLIINDDIELARHIDADGVHIGKDDNSLIQAREKLGEDKIIGVSCYNQLALAEQAIANSANYIAFGSFFGSNIKPDAPRANTQLIKDIKKSFNTPVCCIGGITTENCHSLIEARADMLAVISDVFSSSNEEHIKHKCIQFNQLLNPVV